MSQNSNQDPYSGYGPPENPYGTPPPQDPYGAPPPQNPYGGYQQPQNPYGTPPSQDPYGAPPPQSPYGPPPYDAPSRYEYMSPPPQGSYGPQQGYGYGAGNVAVGYQPVQSAPLPLGEAIRQLPSQYIKIFTKPSAATFAQENGKAAWNIIWAQLLGLAVLSVLFGFAIFSIVLPTALAGNQSTAAMAAALAGGTVALALSMIVFVPLSFFIGTGIQYLIAKMFGGQGAFLNHSYGSILIYVPYTILSVVLSLIPILGSLAGLALSIYSIVLQVYMIMAVHRMGGGRATMVVLFPLIVVFALACVLFFILIAALSSHQAPQ